MKNAKEILRETAIAWAKKKAYLPPPVTEYDTAPNSISSAQVR